jgi:hypothetical protein
MKTAWTCFIGAILFIYNKLYSKLYGVLNNTSYFETDFLESERIKCAWCQLKEIESKLMCFLMLS